MTRTCHVCHTTDDLRPYGPNCQWVCFDCATGTTDAQAATSLAFAAQLEACGDVAFIGLDSGPIPSPERFTQ